MVSDHPKSIGILQIDELSMRPPSFGRHKTKANVIGICFLIFSLNRSHWLEILSTNCYKYIFLLCIFINET